MYALILPDRGVLQLSGPDTETFLQGLLTNDIRKLTTEQPLYAAILTPQGKLLYDIFAYTHEDGVLLEYYLPLKEELLKKLRMYRLRAKVDIVEKPEMKVIAAWGGALSATRDPRHPEMGYRYAATSLPEGFSQASLEEYHYRRIGFTIPEMPVDLVSGESFPLPSNMEAIHAIDYQKGCYVGQEVTARSKYRGNIRKAIFTVRFDALPPPTGTAITAEGRAVGVCLSHARELGLAHLEIEAAQQKTPLQVNGTGLSVLA